MHSHALLLWSHLPRRRYKYCTTYLLRINQENGWLLLKQLRSWRSSIRAKLFQRVSAVIVGRISVSITFLQLNLGRKVLELHNIAFNKWVSGPTPRCCWYWSVITSAQLLLYEGVNSCITGRLGDIRRAICFQYWNEKYPTTKISK